VNTESGTQVLGDTVTDYKIRLATLDDLPALAEIEVEASHRFDGTGLLTEAEQEGRTFNQNVLRKLTEKEQVWVACFEHEPVGFAIYSIFNNTVYLEEIDVMTAHGRRGLATRLIETACEWARKKGLIAMDLTTFEDVLWNAPFYKKLGFQILPRDQWTPEVNARWQDEKWAGLAIEKRVVMRLSLV
jgi:GNAT superfamily N-acetyltransferase